MIHSLMDEGSGQFDNALEAGHGVRRTPMTAFPDFGTRGSASTRVAPLGLSGDLLDDAWGEVRVPTAEDEATSGGHNFDDGLHVVREVKA